MKECIRKSVYYYYIYYYNTLLELNIRAVLYYTDRNLKIKLSIDLHLPISAAANIRSRRYLRSWIVLLILTLEPRDDTRM